VNKCSFNLGSINASFQYQFKYVGEMRITLNNPMPTTRPATSTEGYR